MTLFLVYVFGIVIYNGPLGAAGSVMNYLLALAWAGVLIFCLKRYKQMKYKQIAARKMILGSGMMVVLVPWLLMKPSNERDWQVDFRETGYAEVDGSKVVFYHSRNFLHDKSESPIERWETKRYDLNKLQGIDYFQSNFGGALVAHPILSFDFGSGGRICLSVEARRERGEKFSILGGIYKTFEIQYIFGQESDLVKLRTNVRNEPVYLYRTNATAEQAREILLEAIAIQNELKEEPRFYSIIMANCTSSIRSMNSVKDIIPFDYRVVFNGKLDEKLYKEGILNDRGLSFEELKEQSLINDLANEDVEGVDFSEKIRARWDGT